MPCRLVPSSKGGQKLDLDGWMYHLNKNPKGTPFFYWICDQSWTRDKETKKKIRTCTVKVDTELRNGEHVVMKIDGDHKHKSKMGQAIIEQKRFEMKTLAASTNDKPCQIIQSIKATVPQNLLSELPRKEALRKAIKRVQNKNRPKEPRSLDGLVVPEELQSTISGEKFLQNPIECGDREKIFIFTTTNNLKFLCVSKYWVMDGTFKAAPNLFHQLFTVHCNIADGEGENCIVPVVYALMPGKSQEIYQKLFKKIVDLIGTETIKTEMVICDYEKAVMNAVVQEIPNVKPTGCFFHFKQCLERKLQILGFKKRLDDDPGFRLKINLIGGLAYLSPEEIPSAYRKVKLLMPPETNEFLKYVEQTWTIGELKRTLRNGQEVRNNPLFSPTIWSVASRNELNIPRRKMLWKDGITG